MPHVARGDQEKKKPKPRPGTEEPGIQINGPPPPCATGWRCYRDLVPGHILRQPREGGVGLGLGLPGVRDASRAGTSLCVVDANCGFSLFSPCFLLSPPLLSAVLGMGAPKDSSSFTGNEPSVFPTTGKQGSGWESHVAQAGCAGDFSGVKTPP